MRCDRRGDRGSVTAETALVLPVLALAVAASVWLVHAVAVDIRCTDAAREAARALARGDTLTVATALARRAAPAGATVTLATEGDTATARVTMTVRAARLPGYTIDEVAVAALEPDGGMP